MRKRVFLGSAVAALFAIFLIAHSGIVWHYLPDFARDAIDRELISKWRSFVGEGGLLAYLALYAVVLGGWIARARGNRSDSTLFMAVRAHLPEVLIVALLGYAIYQAADDTLLLVVRLLEGVLARSFDWPLLGRSAAIAALHATLLICAVHVTLGWGGAHVARTAAIVLIVTAIGVPANNTWTIHGHDPHQFLTRASEVMGSVFVTSAIEVWLALVVLRGRAESYRNRLQLHDVGTQNLIPAALTGIGVIVAIQVAVRSLAILPRSLITPDLQMLAINVTWVVGALIALTVSLRGVWRAIASARRFNAPTTAPRRGALSAYRFMAVAVSATAAAALCYFVPASLSAAANLASLSSRGYGEFVNNMLWGLVLVLLAPGTIFCSGIVLLGWSEAADVRRESAQSDNAA
jgi:hypothetical protein